MKKGRTGTRKSNAPGGKSKTSRAGSITDVPGIQAGHAHDEAARTGCTVILCGAEGAVAGVDVRGAAPGTRETDLLAADNLVERVHAVLLTGGSAFGLDAAAGVMRWLEERGIGFDTGVARVPIVPAAVIFDLAICDPRRRPDADMGYAACDNATSEPLAEGAVGAGAGAMVGKLLGMEMASPGGIGTASTKLASGVTIGALAVVNAFGDITDPRTGEILSGVRSPAGGWLDTASALAGLPAQASPRFAGRNTTLAVVATDARLSKAQCRRVATMAHDGLARAIRPVHTMFDGDVVFALSTGEKQADVSVIGAIAADLVAEAIARVGRR